MGMEISLGDWEAAEWSTGEPFDVYGGGDGGVAAASTTQVEDQLLLEGLVGQHITLVDYGLIMPRARSPSLDCLATETNSADSASLCQPHWSATPATVSGMRRQPDYKSNSNASTIWMRKRKRDPDPEHFTLIGSGSGHHAATSGNPLRLIIRESPKPALINCNGTISFQQGVEGAEPDAEAIQQMKEMIYRAAALRPVNLGVEAAERPRRKNVRISTDPQTVAARQRRERISERLRVLQKLVPGGSKMDTASMLDEAANYLKFLRSQVNALEAMASTAATDPSSSNGALPPVCFNFSNSFPNYRLNMQSHQISPPTCNNVNPLLLLHQYAKG